MSDEAELPELRLLDQPMAVPAAFRHRLRAELLATFDADAGGHTGGEAHVVELSPLAPDTRPPRRRHGAWVAAAAAVVLLTAIATTFVARDGDSDGERPVPADRRSACQLFLEAFPGAASIGEATVVSDPSARVGALADLEAAFLLLTLDLARLGEVPATDLDVLQRVSGGVREARLDLEQGDIAGSDAALAFALDGLAGLTSLEIALADPPRCG